MVLLLATEDEDAAGEDAAGEAGLEAFIGTPGFICVIFAAVPCLACFLATSRGGFI